MTKQLGKRTASSASLRIRRRNWKKHQQLLRSAPSTQSEDGHASDEGSEKSDHTSGGRELRQVGDGRRRLLTGAVGLALGGLIAFIGFTYSSDRREPKATPLTFGHIYVDTPEVYTRERLVNDRFTQDAWLKDRLDRTDDLVFDVEGRILEGHTTRSELKVGAGVSAGDRVAAADARTEKPASDEPASGKPDQANQASYASAAPPVSLPIHDFRDRLAYREEVRSEIISNQLDDRHDLVGNTLYRLKFDVSLIPGGNTEATGVVLVHAMSPFEQPAAESEKPPENDFEALRKWLRERGVFRADSQHNARIEDLERMYLSWLRHVEDETTSVLRARLERVQRAFAENSLEPLNDPSARDLYALNDYLLEQQGQQEFDSIVAKHELKDEKAPQVVGFTDPCAKPRNGKVPHLLAVLRCRFEAVEPSYRQPDRRAGLLAKHYVRSFTDSDDPRANRFGAYLWLYDTGADGVTTRPLIERQWLDRIELEKRKKEQAEEPEQAELVELREFPADRQTDKRAGELVKRIGFARFAVRVLMSSNRAYTYAVTPKEAAQRLSSTARYDRSQLLAFDAGVGEAPTSLQASVDELRARLLDAHFVERQPLLVGFSNDRASKAGVAQLGWVFGPRLKLEGERGEARFTHRPSHHSVSAIVSVPSWWPSIKLNIQTFWIDASGKCWGDSGVELSGCDAKFPDEGGFEKPKKTSPVRDDGVTVLAAKPEPPQPSSVLVQLPSSPEAFTELLIESQQLKRPEVFESEMLDTVVQADQPAEIPIPGRRLWRSTMVFLGTQQATSISVLPNMNGIVAHFDNVRAPATWEKVRGTIRPAQPMLTIWTSEGRAMVANKVALHPAPPPAKEQRR